MSQQDFWSSFEGEVTGSAEAANVESLDFETILGGTKAPALAIEIKTTDNQAQIDHANNNGYPAPILEKFYEVQWKLIGGDFKNRQIRMKIRPWKVFEGGDKKGQPDQKARTRQANILRRLMMLTQCPMPQHGGAPSEADLAPCLNKPVAIGIEIWENKNRDGEWNSGNWINELNPADGNFKPETGTKKPKHVQGEKDPAHESGSMPASEQKAVDAGQPDW